MKYSLFLILLLSSCTYFNTFYNAKHFYKQGLAAKNKDTLKIQTSTLELFDKSIQKSAIIVKKHSRSKFVDDALLLMGKSFYEKEEYARARDKFDALDLFYPNSPLKAEASFYRGLCYLGEKNYGMAVVTFNELQESKPHYAENCGYQIGRAYFYQAKYQAVLDHFTEFFTKYSKSKFRTKIWLLMGEASASLKNYTAALNYYNLALKTAKSKVEKNSIKLKIGQSYLLLKEYDAGLEYLKHEIDPEFQLLNAKFLKATGNKTEELKLLKKLSRTRLESEIAAEVFYEMGVLFQEDELLDSAAAYFDSAYAKAPNSTFGEKSIKNKQTINKILEYRAKTEEDPARAQFLLAELYFVNLNDTSRALKEYEKVYNEFPESPLAPKAMYAYAWILDNIFDQDSLAKASYLNLIEKYPNTEYSKVAQKHIGE